MYTSNIRGLGQTYSKPMTLQKAVTSVLIAVGIKTFPGKIVVIDAAKFDLIAQQVINKGNEINWRIPIRLSEVQQALQYRGYRRDVATVAPVVFRSPTTSSVQANGQNRPRQADPRGLFAHVQKSDRTVTTIAANSNVTFTPRSGQPHGIELPVIVPPAPVFPIREDLRPFRPGVDNTFLWIAGILTLYFLTTAEKTPHRSARSKRKESVASDLSGLKGATANCLLWQETEGKSGGLIWRCLKYAPSCSGSSCKTEKYPFQTRTCAKTKKVATKSPYFKLKTVNRCAKYERVCTKSTCLPEPFQKPDPSPGHGVNIKRMIQDMARQMADDRNEDEETVGKSFGREIMDRGGIRPYRGRSRSGKRVRGGEEFAAVPVFMRRKEGLPLDEMASEMGFDDDTALLEAIKTEYPKVRGAKKRTWSANDFMADAESQVWNALDAGMISGLSGAPDYVWQSTIQEFTERQRTGKDPSLPDELNWILSKTKANNEGLLRVFKGKLPGHMTKRLRAWLSDRYLEPDRWLEDKRLDIGFRSGKTASSYTVKHPHYNLMVKFYRDGSVMVTEDRGNYHGESVIKALEEGRNVPPKVLTQYAPYIPSAKKALNLGGLGQDLFPGLKRELVLATEDFATSDDPLDIFLQRKGWDLKRVQDLQANIAEKAVPDMFTNKMAPATAGEVELQRDIQEFFDKTAPARTQRKKKPAKKAKKAPKIDPFWVVDPVQQRLFGSY